ncbi:hypothetical protein [Rhizobium sp. N324]|uniref:hypothetical protein n=1 Tax=Rhizobium sp. N324 TaxID=1703969 RepID=UPI0007EB5429|nr:hypothetical protein [Rhizobium sp. N324]ANM12089.1 hypothetical protein AMK05_CH03740 [Rhizobium sp. N324]
MRPPIDVRIHDAHVGIWQDNAQDASFRTEIYAVLIRHMRARGWSIRRNPETHRRHRCISANFRDGARGTLRCAISLSGRAIEVEFWSMTSKQSNQNGRRYDFDKLKRMAYLDRLRVGLEFKRVTTWLKTIAPVKVSLRDERDLAPMERIEKSYAESWHSDKDLGRPVCKYDYNAKTKDGRLLQHGQTVWLPDHKGRIIRGTAYYHINNMWWVVAGGELFNRSSIELFVTQPNDLRTKGNERDRRKALERELSIAVERMDFKRAQGLKQIIFGGEQTFMIWSRGNRSYYRSQYAGYTTDRIAAGKYTRAEAEAECRRAPHELEMVCPDGSHVRFDRSAA